MLGCVKMVYLDVPVCDDSRNVSRKCQHLKRFRAQSYQHRVKPLCHPHNP